MEKVHSRHKGWHEASGLVAMYEEQTKGQFTWPTNCGKGSNA